MFIEEKIVLLDDKYNWAKAYICLNIIIDINIEMS